MRQTRRQSKGRRKSIRGGKKIGQGSFGQVFAPPLKCKGNNNSKVYGEGYVSKILRGSDVEEEYEKAMLVKAMDPEGAWSITPEKGCVLAAEQTNTNYTPGEETDQIIYKHGGRSVMNLLLAPEHTGDPFKYIRGINAKGVYDKSVFAFLDPSGLSEVIKSIKNIIPSLDILNTKYLHNDLHSGNIVYDGATTRLIDFASLTPVETILASESKFLKNCLKTSSDERCSYAKKIIEKIVNDTCRTRDVKTIWLDLVEIIQSPWVTETFPGKFTAWLEKYKHLDSLENFRSDYIVSIYTCPP